MLDQTHSKKAGGLSQDLHMTWLSKAALHSYSSLAFKSTGMYRELFQDTFIKQRHKQN